MSVGLDSKVVVWSGYTFEKLKTISNHQSHVKGVTFDPANKYFATASDDRTVRIFRFVSPTPTSTSHDSMNNFVLEQTITAPFVNSPLTTYFRRCSWSPDGNHIAAANAVNGPVSSVAIINRGTWDSEISFIGHEAPVEACAFAPRLYASQSYNKTTKQGLPMPTVTVIACASADKSLSVWITNNARPIVIAQDIAGKSLSDLSWSPDGMCLFATALDGTIVAVCFEESEIGHPMPLEENEKTLTKYGTNRKGGGIVESTDSLVLEEKAKAGELQSVKGRMGALMGDGHASNDKGTSGIESRVANDQGTAGSSAAIATIPPKQQANGSVNGTATEKEKLEKPDPHAAKLERLKQRPTYTKEGKKRIAPLLVSGTGGTTSSLPQSRLVAASSSQSAKYDSPDSVLDLSKPFDGFPKGGLASLLFGNKRKYAHIEGDEENSIEKRVAQAAQNGATPLVTDSSDGLHLAQPEASSKPKHTPEFIRPAVVNPSLSTSQLRLAVPKVRTHILQGIDSLGDPADVFGSNPLKPKADVVFEARNSTVSLTGRYADREPVRVTLSRGEQLLWQDFIPKTALLVTGNQKFWAAACEDGSVYIWTPAGRRLLNVLVLEAQPVILECKDSWLLCISAVGMCYVWNVISLSSPHPPVSLAPILDAATHLFNPHPNFSPAVNSARLNSEGRIIVALSNGEGYSYTPSLYTWQRMSEGWWAVGSQYWNTTDASVGNLQSSAKVNETTRPVISAGIIPFLERNTTKETLIHGRGYFLQRLIKILLSREGFETFESSVSIAHLENRVAAALSLGAKEEFRVYLSMYAKRIGAEGLKAKAEELLEGIIGGIFEDGDTKDNAPKPDNQNLKSPNTTEDGAWISSSENLCGWPRRELLSEVILALGMMILPIVHRL